VKKKIAAALVLLLAAGCAGEHPGAALAQQQGRQPGYIRPGDTMPYVRAQWGVPYQTERSTYTDMTSDWWTYCAVPGPLGWGCDAAGSIVHFVDGKVYAIHQ
jgi:hypothetical protein